MEAHAINQASLADKSFFKLRQLSIASLLLSLVTIVSQVALVALGLSVPTVIQTIFFTTAFAIGAITVSHFALATLSVGFIGLLLAKRTQRRTQMQLADESQAKQSPTPPPTIELIRSKILPETPAAKDICEEQGPLIYFHAKGDEALLQPLLIALSQKPDMARFAICFEVFGDRLNNSKEHLANKLQQIEQVTGRKVLLVFLNNKKLLTLPRLTELTHMFPAIKVVIGGFLQKADITGMGGPIKQEICDLTGLLGSFVDAIS